MKHIITLLIVTAALIALPSPSQASDYCRSSYCAPVVRNTCEVGRCNEYRWATDSCGHRIRYTVTVVTYRSYYSDGSSRTFTRSYRA